MSNGGQSDIFNYDVFISYKSEQESWAVRIAETLHDFGLHVWRDHDAEHGLRAGENWSDKIQNAIRDSKIVVVLWSGLIADDATTMVLEEIKQAEQYIKNDPTGQRRFIPIALDGTSIAGYSPLVKLHADESFVDLYKKSGDGGARDVDDTDWSAAMRNLINALGIRDVWEIRYVVAAMRQKQAQQLMDNPDAHSRQPEAFRLMCSIMNKTSKFDIKRYGESPDDWKPFPQFSFTIRELLNEFDFEKRSHYRETKEAMTWLLASYSQEIVSDDAAIREFAQAQLQDKPCLVIVDPVSLLHERIFHRIIASGGFQNHPHAYVIGLAPYISQLHPELQDTTSQLNTIMEEYLEAAYNHFKTLYEPGDRACIMNINDERQLLRWLQVAADRIVSRRQTPLSSKRVHRSRASLFSRKGPTGGILQMSNK